MKERIVGVIGGHSCTPEVEQIAHKLGKYLAKVGYKVVCGGFGGGMSGGGGASGRW